MKKGFVNRTHIEGWVYESGLELKVSGPNSKNPGTEFINGNLSIATDDAMLNIVTIHFSYVTAMTSKGNTNATFTTLKNIIDGKICNVMEHGADKAGKLRIDSAVDLNEFYSDRNGEEELVSVKRNEGGFIHTTNTLDADENKRATFEVDMLITGTTRIEADEERGIQEHVVVKGAVFNFRNALLPVEFNAYHAGAMDYFEGLEASNKEPVLTKVWGRQISQTTTRTISEESAFGEDNVREVTNTRRDFIITGAAKEPYLWDDESTLTAAELKAMIAERETYLATLKARQDEYKAARANSTIQAAPSTKEGAFDF